MNAAEAFEKSRQSAKKAIEINPNAAEAHNSLGYTLAFYDWNWTEAEKEFRKAISLNPNYPTARQWFGEYLLVFGRFAETEEEILRAPKLDPTSQIIASDLAGVYYISKEFDKCLEYTAKTLQKDEKSAYGNAFRWLCFEAKGDLPNAFEALQKGDKFLYPPEIIKGPQNANETGGWQGGWKYKEEFFDRFPTNQFLNNYTRAFVSLRAGNKDKAFEWLEKSFQNHERWFVNLKFDPQFESLRNDPRFAELVRKANMEPF
jgi:tetratricopeptide (TPR) repeat protein